jgi:hypothetical protein
MPEATFAPLKLPVDRVWSKALGRVSSRPLGLTSESRKSFCPISRRPAAQAISDDPRRYSRTAVGVFICRLGLHGIYTHPRGSHRPVWVGTLKAVRYTNAIRREGEMISRLEGGGRRLSLAHIFAAAAVQLVLAPTVTEGPVVPHPQEFRRDRELSPPRRTARKLLQADEPQAEEPG